MARVRKQQKTQIIFVEKEVGLGNYTREFQNKEIALLNLSQKEKVPNSYDNITQQKSCTFNELFSRTQVLHS